MWFHKGWVWGLFTTLLEDCLKHLPVIPAEEFPKNTHLTSQQNLTFRSSASFLSCFQSWSGILSLFVTESKFESEYNALNDKWSWNPLSEPYTTFVQTPEVRRALHVGDAEYTSLGVVYYKMIPDFMTDVRSALETVLDNYKVLFYNGQFDIICAYPLTVNMLNTLKFQNSLDYKKTRRKPWYVGGKLAGYVKSINNLTEILVRNAGHMVPFDKPEWALDMVTRFTSKADFF